VCVCVLRLAQKVNIYCYNFGLWPGSISQCRGRIENLVSVVRFTPGHAIYAGIAQFIRAVFTQGIQVEVLLLSHSQLSIKPPSGWAFDLKTLFLLSVLSNKFR
jgi:hypothetical protein